MLRKLSFSVSSKIQMAFLLFAAEEGEFTTKTELFMRMAERGGTRR